MLLLLFDARVGVGVSVVCSILMLLVVRRIAFYDHIEIIRHNIFYDIL